VIVAAAIAGITSVAVAFLTQSFSWFSGGRIERLRSELTAKVESTRAEMADLNSSRSARRDYEYDARKRLYAEIEPLLFQLFEAAEQSYNRVKSLARTAQQGSLSTGPHNWLDKDGYYLTSTIYYLFLTTVVFRLIKDRMTFVDLDLDEKITTKYYLTKIYAIAWTDDFVLSREAKTKLGYDPNHADWQNLISSDPAQYRRQGLNVGYVEALLDAMAVKDGKTTRAMTYAEFDARMREVAHATEEVRMSDDALRPFSEIRRLFLHFSPSNCPVLARILLVLGCLSYLILESYEQGSASELRQGIRPFVESDEFGKAFAWAGNTELSGAEREVVLEYVDFRVAQIPDRTRRQTMLT
jgi:hypothetical protein